MSVCIEQHAPYQEKVVVDVLWKFTKDKAMSEISKFKSANDIRCCPVRLVF